ncbi:16S rRNA (uracil(1498)-N(3))-methyltransferase [Liquorilactobacillus uvarum]|uniref:16S rRNA (uracil(1498)-N(3))-methyltransferase n=1 Tax=Liquorilactobacillus uvarum TaxID=303240 RepID=UPI00288BE777|nr:16S rRNA (uracil(1498)-N(3))-methyltransferase [Liquorilactobacillus uvarum]
MQRYFIEQSKIDSRLVLPTEIYHHAVIVMRMKPGDCFEVVAADKKVAVMELEEIAEHSATARVCKKIEHTVELPLQVTIVCGLSKKDKADWIVQKATELGAQHFIFFSGDYSIVKWDKKKQEKKLVRLRKIIRGASEQSHRVMVPTVSYIENIKTLQLEKYSEKMVAYEEAAKEGETASLAKIVSKVKKQQGSIKDLHLVAVFGPEGGISPAEIQYLKSNDFSLTGLGPRIMRAETAPLYLLSALSYALELN